MTDTAHAPTGLTPPTSRPRPLTDLGNAERLVARHGIDLRYVTAWRSWLVWDGTRWRRDDLLEIEQRAKDTVRAIFPDECVPASAEERPAIAKHAFRSEATNRIRAMIECARAEPSITTRYQAFDAHPFLLTLLNGTMDLSTGSLRTHRRDDLITKRVDIVWDAKAECPTWLGFLDRIFDGNADLIAYLQRAVGYSLTADTREQCLHLLHGSGSNGKTTFLEVLSGLLGDYGVQADFTTFLEKKSDGPRNDIARLASARVVRSSEVGEGKRLNESLVKSLTGQDTIAARYLYQESFEFAPTFKVWLAANHKPVVRGTDYAIWRRVRLIPFTVTISDDEKDETIKDRLLAELPGILRWAVDGCLQWLESGLRAPATVTAATQAYQAESDILAGFLDECCELGSGLEAPATELYLAYKAWAQANGEYLWTNTLFGRRLEERGFESRKSGVKYRTGLRLLPNVVKKSDDQWWQK